MTHEDYKRIVIDTPKDGTPKEVILDELIKIVQTYLTEEDIKMIKKAYEVADELHKGQKRRSGEEYIIHPLCVAYILATLHMDVDTLIAGILHDVIEDTNYTYEDVEREFSKHVADLVDGVTKLTNLNLANDKVASQAENLRHMFLAMSKDVRVIIIKLADRLHNLRTLEYQSKEKQEEKSLETLEIYSPIANRLGITKIKTQMDDLSLRYLKPKEYAELQKSIKVRKEAREEFIDKIVTNVHDKLKLAGIEAKVYGRVKNLFSIYKKMVNKKKTIDEIYDLFAIRILVQDVKDCYAALGIIHEFYTPIPGRFKDYIAMPKPNNYQSLHTTVFGDSGIPFEIQIRTYAMHEVDELGIAAHWAYKEQGGSKGVKDLDELKQMNWLKEILSASGENKNSNDFLNYVKEDLDVFKSKIYCFTPDGDVITLPQDSTPIDFAYMIHSAVGNKMVGAKVNGALVPIDYKIQNGDQISIITSQNSNGPSRDWLNIVKSHQAKTKIEHWFKVERRDENIVQGKNLVEKYCKAKKIDFSELTKDDYIKAACKKYTCSTLDDLYAMVGHGGIKESQLITKLREEYNKEHEANMTDEEVAENIDKHKVNKKSNSSDGIVVSGADDLQVKFAHCCSPVPGDEIVGFVTRGRGLTIHRTDCKNIMNLPDVEKNRLIEATWDSKLINTDNTYEASLRIFINNRKGLLVDISRVFTESNIDITSIDSHQLKNDKIEINISFDVKDRETVSLIQGKLRSVEGVYDIERA